MCLLLLCATPVDQTVFDIIFLLNRFLISRVCLNKDSVIFYYNRSFYESLAHERISTNCAKQQGNETLEFTQITKTEAGY